MWIWDLIKVCRKDNANFTKLPLSLSVKLVNFPIDIFCKYKQENNSCCYVKQLINFYICVRGITWNPKLPRGIIRSHRTDLGNVTAASKTSHRTEKHMLAWPISLIIQTIALGLNLKGRTKCLLHHVLGKNCQSIFMNSPHNSLLLWLWTDRAF